MLVLKGLYKYKSSQFKAFCSLGMVMPACNPSTLASTYKLSSSSQEVCYPLFLQIEVSSDLKNITGCTTHLPHSMHNVLLFFLLFICSISPKLEVSLSKSGLTCHTCLY